MAKTHLEVIEAAPVEAEQAMSGNNPLIDEIAALQIRLEAAEAQLAAVAQHIQEHSHSIAPEVIQQISSVAAQAAVLHINEHLATLLTMGKTLLEK